MRYTKELKQLLVEETGENKDSPEASLKLVSKGIKSRKSLDSVDSQIDGLILRYENSSIRDEESQLMESLFNLSLRSLLIEQEEEAEEEAVEETEDTGGETASPSGTEEMSAKAPAKEEIPNLNIDQFTTRCVRLVMNFKNLLRIEEAILNRCKNFLDENYGDEYVTEYLNILSDEHGIELKEFNDEEMNDAEPDIPFAVGANPAGAGGT